MTTQTPFDENNWEKLSKELKTVNLMYAKIFKLGQKDMLEKVLIVIEQWNRGLYSNEEMKKVLKDYYALLRIK